MNRTALTLITFLMLLTPMANAVTIDGPLNLVGTHGGIVRFGNTVTSTRVNIVNALWRFASFNDGGNMGALGLDCDTGVNMTLTDITLITVTYTVSGAGDQYVYYKHEQPMDYTGATDVDYNDGNGVATVTAPDGATVVLQYERASNELILAGRALASFMAIVFIAFGLRMEGDMRQKMTYMAVVIAVYMAMVYWIQNMGY